MNENKCTINVHFVIGNCTLFYSYLSDFTGFKLAALKVR